MKKQDLRTLVLVAGAAALFGTAASATPYYLFDGDSQRAIEINGGAVVNSFDIIQLGYPVAITNTIWLGHRDNQGASQYTLGGVATGATSAGGATISQLLDGTTNGVNNYGVTCCAGQNVVTVADSDWSNQHTLFNIGVNAQGIAFDTLSNSLYVSDFGGGLTNYSLGGAILGQFNVGNIAGLAYEQSSDTLWGWNRSNSNLQQFSLTGTLLQSQSINAGAFGISNPFGGEMIMGAVGGVPEASTWALMLVGFGAAGAALRRGRKLATA